MSNCKIMYKQNEGESRKVLITEDEGIDKVLELCTGEGGICPTPLAAQAPIALRYHVDPTKVLITWSDGNAFPIEEPQSHNGYTIEHKNHPDDAEWMLIGTVYPGNGWPGADDPIIEFLHEIMDTHDLTRVYRIRAFNHCGNYSSYVTVGMELNYVGYLRVWNAEDTVIDDVMYFLDGEYGEVNAKERRVKTAESGASAVNWYLHSIDWGTGAANWFYLQEFSTGSWQQLVPGSQYVYPHNTLIRIVCLEETPGDRNASVIFKTMAGEQTDILINTSTV